MVDYCGQCEKGEWFGIPTICNNSGMHKEKEVAWKTRTDRASSLVTMIRKPHRTSASSSLQRIWNNLQERYWQLAEHLYELLPSNAVSLLTCSQILTTSLTRRGFNSTTGKVIENLAEQAGATISVAKKLHVPYIDLNQASTDYINAVGTPLSDTYNLIPSDRTHLNPSGELLFGNLVSVLIVGALRDGKKWTKPNATIATALAHGTFISPTTLESTTNSTAPSNWS